MKDTAGQMVWDKPCIFAYDKDFCNSLSPGGGTNITEGNCAVMDPGSYTVTVEGAKDGRVNLASSSRSGAGHEIDYTRLKSIQADVTLKPGCTDSNAVITLQGLRVAPNPDNMVLWDYQLTVKRESLQVGQGGQWHVDARVMPDNTLKVVHCKPEDTIDVQVVTEYGTDTSLKMCKNFETSEAYRTDSSESAAKNMMFVARYLRSEGKPGCGNTDPTCAIQIDNLRTTYWSDCVNSPSTCGDDDDRNNERACCPNLRRCVSEGECREHYKETLSTGDPGVCSGWTSSFPSVHFDQCSVPDEKWNWCGENKKPVTDKVVASQIIADLKGEPKDQRDAGLANLRQWPSSNLEFCDCVCLGE